MSRSGYSDDLDNWSLIKWRGRVASAIRGKRGQAFLKEALAALNAMPVKELVSGELETEGQFCTLGVVGRARGFDLTQIDTYDHETLGTKFDIAACLSQEIMYMNDEYARDWEWITPPGESHAKRIKNPMAGAQRWEQMRAWLAGNIKADEVPA
jgi:hypothetical protein